MFNTCEYVCGAGKKDQFPNKENLNEFVFLGRSNVGKSSLINAITNRKMLAYTSSKPGKTIAINFFLIDKSFYLVDVPGYGFALKSQSMKEQFGKYIENYLNDNHNLKVAFLLVDSKVGPTQDDILMYNYLKYFNINVKIIGTKSDKIGSTLVLHQKKIIKEKLNCSNDDIIMTSSTSRKGIDNIVEILSSF